MAAVAPRRDRVLQVPLMSIAASVVTVYGQVVNGTVRIPVNNLVLSHTHLGFLGVEFEEQGYAVGVGCGRLESVCLVDKRVEMRMGFHEIRRHRAGLLRVMGHFALAVCQWIVYNLCNRTGCHDNDNGKDGTGRKPETRDELLPGGRQGVYGKGKPPKSQG